MPASGNRSGRAAGRPLTSSTSPASDLSSTLPASGGTAGHHASRPNSAVAQRQQRRPAALCSGASSSTTRPSSESPWRGGWPRQSTSAAIASAIAHSSRHVAIANRGTRGSSLDRGEHPELEDEPVVVRRQLTVDPGGEGVVRERRAQQRRGLAPPPLALGEPRERAARRELPGRLGDQVVVRRRSAALERGEVLLVPADLPHRQFRYPRTGRRPLASRRAAAGSRRS